MCFMIRPQLVIPPMSGFIGGKSLTNFTVRQIQIGFQTSPIKTVCLIDILLAVVSSGFAQQAIPAMSAVAGGQVDFGA